MNNTDYPPQESFQKVLTNKLNRTCHALQKIEQRMILTGHRSDQIAARMKKIRQDILSNCKQLR